MARISTSPAHTKSRTAPSRPAFMAADHSRATAAHLACAAPSSPLHTTANRTLPVRSQFLPTASKIFIKISARKGMDRSMDTPQGDPVSGWNGVNSTSSRRSTSRAGPIPSRTHRVMSRGLSPSRMSTLAGSAHSRAAMSRPSRLGTISPTPLPHTSMESKY